MSAADIGGSRHLEVGILGATGMVGQQFVRLLAGHPWFKTAWLGASERSEGRTYREAMKWRLSTPPPDDALAMNVDACTPGRAPRILFSALDAGAAKDIEPAFAAAGHIVVSNARSYRMCADVPLVIPEVNADHLTLIARQRRERGWTGAIVTNPNCSTVVLSVVLAALRRFGLSRVMVTTLQAVSGAGYPGVASLDILGNVIPAISGEEEKMESETLKILGSDGGRSPYPAVVSAHTNRVAVIDGHTMTASVAFTKKPTIDAIKEAMRSFAGKPQELWLPSAPQPPLVVTEEPNRPQPRLDADLGGGMAITIGRVRECPVLHAKFVALGHNTIRVAAGAAILNAELMHSEGMLQ